MTLIVDSVNTLPVIDFVDAPPAGARTRVTAPGGDDWSAWGFVGGAGESLVLNGANPWRVVLGAQSPQRRGAALGARLAGCPGPVSVELGLSPADCARFAQGLLLKVRPAPALRGRPDPAPAPPLPGHVAIVCADPAAAAGHFARLVPVAEGVFLARDLINRPGNMLGPAELAASARDLSALGVAVRLIDPASAGLGLLAAVGQGSARPPILAELVWRGAGTDQAPVAMVGKAITFDAGGISIKPADGMADMKGDMGGGAAVLGAMHALAGRRAAVNVVGVLAIAENMPGAGALRPGDVVRAFDGQTVEVVDTDAEGRLVLADALAWTARTWKPRAMVDLATLTGAVVRVLGRHRAGLYANRDGLARRLAQRAEAMDELLWRLPLCESCDQRLKSDVADWKNCGWGAVPDNDDAARFLHHFVPASLPWAHLDIAGVSESDDGHRYGPKGGVGFGVRLLDAWAGG